MLDITTNWPIDAASAKPSPALEPMFQVAMRTTNTYRKLRFNADGVR